MEDKPKLKKFLLVFVATLAFSVFVAIGLNLSVTTRADQNSVSVKFSPSILTIKSSNPFPFQLAVTTAQGGGIAGIDTRLKVNGPIQISQKSTLTSSNPSVVYFSSVKTSDRFSFSTASETSQLPSSVVIPFDVKCTGAGQASVELDQQTSQFTGTASGGVFGISSTDSVTINCDESGVFTAGDKAIAKFDPQSQSAEVGGTLNYRLILKPEAEIGMSGFHVSVKYDPEIVEVMSITEPVVLPVGTDGVANALGGTLGVTPPPMLNTSPTGAGGIVPTVSAPTAPAPTAPAPTSPASGGGSCTTNADCKSPCLDPTAPGCAVTCVNGTCQASPPSGGGGGGGGGGGEFVKIRNEVDADTGLIHLSYIVNGPNSQLLPGVVFDIALKGIKDGTGKLEFNKADITGNVEGVEYDVEATPADYKIGSGGGGGGGTGNIKLNLRLKLQGVTKKPATVTSIPIKIGIGDGTLEAPIYQTGTFTVDDNGIWSGTVSFQAFPGDGYKVTAKPPLGSQKRFCDADADDGVGTEGFYECTRGNLTLTEGENTFDFSKVAILAGDIGVQNGIVNAGDLIDCRIRLGMSDPDALSVADVNYDGGVNNLDCAAILTSMQNRLDQK